MKLWPSDQFEIETTLSPDAAADALSRQVEPKKMMRLSREHLLFEGVVSPGSFEIARIIHNRNAFRPMVSGRFVPAGSGTRVMIRMGLHPLAAVFLCVWIGLVSVFGLLLLSWGFEGDSAAFPMVLAPIGMLLFAWLLTAWGFWLEVKKQKAMLEEIFRE